MTKDDEANLGVPATLSWLTMPSQSAAGYERSRYHMFPTLRAAVKAWGELEAEQRASASILTDDGLLGPEEIERLFRRILPSG